MNKPFSYLYLLCFMYKFVAFLPLITIKSSLILLDSDQQARFEDGRAAPDHS